MPYSDNKGYSTFLSLVMVFPKDFTENFCVKMYCLNNLLAGSGFIMLFDGPESINIFNPKLGMEMNGSFGMLLMAFMSIFVPRLLRENFQEGNFGSYTRVFLQIGVRFPYNSGSLYNFPRN